MAADRDPPTRGQRLFFWFAGVAAAIGMGWLGATLHLAGRAPIGLTPLGLGVALGLVVGVLAEALPAAPKKRLVGRTLALAFLAAIAQHAWLYEHFRGQWHQARAAAPEIAQFRPQSPWSPAEYFSRELAAAPGRVAALWVSDAALLVAGAVGVMLVWRRKQTPPAGTPEG
jgi:hypothetical protein